MKKETDFTLPEEYLNKSNLIPKVEQIELLSKHILDLQKDKGYLTDKVRELEQENEQIKNSDTLCKLIGEQKRKIAELEQKIEEMKCCENCKYYNNHYNEVVCKRQVINCKRILRQATRDQWEIKEK